VTAPHGKLKGAALKAAVRTDPWVVIEFDAEGAKKRGAYRKAAKQMLKAARKAGAPAAMAAFGHVTTHAADRSSWGGEVGLALSLAGPIDQTALGSAIEWAGLPMGRKSVNQRTTDAESAVRALTGPRWRRHWRRGIRLYVAPPRQTTGR
jgi:hypothetical protein